MSNPCLVCGVPTTNGPRCEEHKIRRKPGYTARARAVVDRANADPDTRCIRCKRPARAGDPWEAGHYDPTDPTEEIGPEHRSCNRGNWNTPVDRR